MAISSRVRMKARRLLDNDRVILTKIDPDEGTAAGLVRGGSGTYSVTVSINGTFTCTCAWGDHQPRYSTMLCSHALALKIAAGF